VTQNLYNAIGRSLWRTAFNQPLELTDDPLANPGLTGSFDALAVAPYFGAYVFQSALLSLILLAHCSIPASFNNDQAILEV
jgi:hypothetical protein